MPQELVHVATRKLPMRVAMILFLIVAAVWSYFVLSWYIGNTLAENFNVDQREIEVARAAVNLAPNDPLTHWRLATVSQAKLPFNQIHEAIAEYEKAVSLSPNDYRFWTSLGTAYEQAGEHDKGEIALRRAVSLAPSYSQPHWFLGNLLLRRARYDDAFKELRLATDANEQLRPQLFIMLWEVYGSNFDSLSKAVGDRASTRSEFALYLLKQKRFAEGLQIWSTLSSNDKIENKETANLLITNLLGSQRYYDALSIWNDVAPSAKSRATIDRITDGGFETVTNYGPEMIFAWQVKNAVGLQIGVDPGVAHSGARSLRLVFQVRTKLSALSATQLVAVTPDTNYDFEFYRKSQRLESGSTPVVQITNPIDGSALATSDGAANGDSDWQQVNLSFKTPPKVQAVVVSIVRSPCFEAEVCPIFGTVWYDDFSLKRRN